MSHKFKTLIIPALAFALILPFVALAAIVPECGRANQAPCTFCNLLSMMQNLLDFIVKYVIFVGGIIFIMIGGFDMITAGGDPTKYKKGWDRVRATLIGILIAIFAWAIVNTILNILAVDEAGQPIITRPWDTITCDQIEAK